MLRRPMNSSDFDFDVLIDYQQGRWHVELKASNLPLKAWGGAGSSPEEAVKNAVKEMVKEL